MIMRRGGRVLPGAVAVLAVTASMLVGPAANAASVSATADANLWQTDGRVDSLAYSADGTKVFLGGIFHHLCPAKAPVCGATTAGNVAVDYLAALDVATGAPVTSWRPQPDGDVEALRLSADGSTLFAGGVFNNLAGQVHHKLAAVTASTGVPVAAWKPNVSAEIKALALSPDGTALYLGGTFKKVNTVARSLVAAVSAYSATATTATLLAWDPEPSGTDTTDKGSLIPAIVNSLVVRPTDGQVYVGGVFTTIGGLARSNVAAVGPGTAGGTGAGVASFSMTPSLHFVTLTVQLTRDGSTLFANGRGPGGFLRAYDSSTGSQLWARKFDGDVQAAVATDTVVFIGGHFDNIAHTGTTLLDVRHHLAAVDAATGVTDAWGPAANSAFGVYSMAWSPGHIIAGGDFTKIDNLAHEGVAQFSGGDTVAPTAPTGVTATSTTKGRVDVSWSQSADADSPTVGYRVYRRTVGGTFALLAEQDGPTGGATQQTYADTTGTIGTAYEYAVRAADPVFLSPFSAVAGPVTVAGDQFAPSVPTAVAATSPSHGNVAVTWQGGGDGDDATVTYTVTRTTGTTHTVAGTVAGPASGSVSFADAVVAGGTFTYTVTASDGTFASAASVASAPVVVAADTGTPTVPGALTVTSTSPNAVQVTWNPSTDADQSAAQLSYQVSRKLGSATGTGTVVARTAPGVTSFTDTVAAGGIAADKRYTYYVAATDGARTSAKSAGVSATVRSSVLTDAFTSLAAWTLPPAPSGVTLDGTHGHAAAPSAQLVSVASPHTNGYAHRDLGGAYPTVCVLEWVSVSAYDTRANGQTTLMRLYSTAGNDISRLYIDNKGALWIRSDWGSNPTITHITVPADGSWHSAQLCTTTTPDAVSGTLSAWWDNAVLERSRASTTHRTSSRRSTSATPRPRATRSTWTTSASGPPSAEPGAAARPGSASAGRGERRRRRGGEAAPDRRLHRQAPGGHADPHHQTRCPDGGRAGVLVGPGAEQRREQRGQTERAAPDRRVPSARLGRRQVGHQRAGQAGRRDLAERPHHDRRHVRRHRVREQREPEAHADQQVAERQDPHPAEAPQQPDRERLRRHDEHAVDGQDQAVVPRRQPVVRHGQRQRDPVLEVDGRDEHRDGDQAQHHRVAQRGPVAGRVRLVGRGWSRRVAVDADGDHDGEADAGERVDREQQRVADTGDVTGRDGRDGEAEVDRPEQQREGPAPVGRPHQVRHERVAGRAVHVADQPDQEGGHADRSEATGGAQERQGEPCSDHAPDQRGATTDVVRRPAADQLGQRGADAVRDESEADLAGGETALVREVEDGERLDERARPVHQGAGPQHPVRAGERVARGPGGHRTTQAQRSDHDREHYCRPSRTVLQEGPGMDAREIEQAYEPFVAAVRAGGFRAPTVEEGWTADMVVAHVTLNNDHWSRAARELLSAGASSYDNETAVADELLQAHVDALGDRDALVADLERSIRELGAANDALGELGALEIPVRIVHDGGVMRDAPAPLGSMIEGNATYHLQMHFEQLLALR